MHSPCKLTLPGASNIPNDQSDNKTTDNRRVLQTKNRFVITGTLKPLMKSNSLMKFFAHIQIIYFSSLVEFWLWLNFLRQIASAPDHTAQPVPLTFLTRCSQLLSYDSLTMQTLPAREIEASLMTVFWKLFDLSRIYSHSIFYHSYTNHPVVCRKVVNLFNIYSQTSNKQILVCYSRAKWFTVLAATAYKSSTIIDIWNHLWRCAPS